MPTARPMVVIMFVAKTDTSAISPSNAVSASAMTMAISARKIGRPAAAIVPKTTRRTISASGMPMPSPLARSSFAAALKSWFTLAVPTTRLRKPAAGAACDDVAQRRHVLLGLVE